MKLSRRSKIEDVKTFNLEKNCDERGTIVNLYGEDELSKMMSSLFHIGYGYETYSNKYVLRGLHYQINKPQTRLLRVTYGAIYDVVLDLRKSSPTFGKWQAEFLSSENSGAILIPAGVAHSYLVASQFAIVNIHSDEEYQSESQRVIRWDDKDLAIDWPLYDNYPIMVSPILSVRDRAGVKFIDAEYYE